MLIDTVIELSFCFRQVDVNDFILSGCHFCCFAQCGRINGINGMRSQCGLNTGGKCAAVFLQPFVIRIGSGIGELKHTDTGADAHFFYGTDRFFLMPVHVVEEYCTGPDHFQNGKT